jgi:hypothetical protein
LTATRVAALALALGLALGGCGGTSATGTRATKSPSRSTGASHHAVAKPRPPAPPAYPRVLGAATATGSTGFVPAVSWRGRTAVWIARSGGVAMLSFDQRLLTLRLHSGTVDAGSSGWRYGPAIAGRERRRLVAAFNGAFKLDTNSGGFELAGRVGAPLTDGLGSIVTYTSGYTDIGAWRQGVPAPGQGLLSVRQNLHLLIAGGHPAANLGCLVCWGATLGGTATPARSALGITADGRLIWAGGENLTTAALASALLSARVQRAVELDINPEWVAAYLYGHPHGRGPLAPIPALPGQHGVAGEFLAPYSRDFFTIVAR